MAFVEKMIVKFLTYTTGLNNHAQILCYTPMEKLLLTQRDRW